MLQQATLRHMYFSSVALVSILAYLGFQPRSSAQIIPDSSLPTASVVTLADSIYTITDGSSRGANLFHSFDEFSVPDSSTALFDNALTIERIITRITGDNLSNIEGLIQANGNADLFLINPNGIVFGENAQLDIGGSFVVSTADQMEFEDGTILSTSTPSASPLLTVSAPVGLQYGSSPGDITVLGPGNGLGFDADNFVLDRSQQAAGLTINNGETLALAGGNIVIQGGNLTAADGRVELGSVAGTEEIGLDELEVGWDLTYDTVAQFQGILLSQSAAVDVSGTNGGSLHLQGQTLRLRGGSTLLATTLGSGSGGQTVLNASDRLIVKGFSTAADGSPVLPSSVIAGLESGATGTGGTVDIIAPILRVVDGGAIASNNLGAGTSGNLTITVADQIRVDGGIPGLEFSGGLLADVYAEGNGGDLSIDTGLLTVEGGGEISASTLGAGNSGRLSINANTVSVDFGAFGLGASSILSTVQPDAMGDAGDLTIVAKSLSVSAGAVILSTTFGDGNGGNLIIAVPNIDVSGVSPGGNAGGIAADTEDGSGQAGDISINTDQLSVSDGAIIASSTVGGSGDGGNLRVLAQTIDVSGVTDGSISSLLTENNDSDGNGGNISIETNQLRLSQGAQISSTTSGNGNGNGGNIRIVAQDIRLQGTSEQLTGVLAAVNEEASGQGGDLAIEAQTLTVTDAAQIVVGTQGSGDGGNLNVDINTIRLAGSNQTGQSGLFASAIVGTGDGGDVLVRGDRLTIENGATISASNFPSDGDARRIGQGAAGIVNIDVGDIWLSDKGTITASTSTGGRGNVSIHTNNMFLTNLSQITTNSLGQEQGGNIVIDTDILVGLGNSDITANAVAGNGGNVNISAQDLFGLEFRERPTLANDITASSEFGFNGTVEINSPDIDLSAQVLELPDTFVDVSQLIRPGCSLDEDQFVIVGRGGLASHPFDLQTSSQPWFDMRTLSASEATASNHRAATLSEQSFTLAPPQEATRMAIAPNGTVQLVASNTQSAAITHVSCISRQVGFEKNAPEI
ncbi:MAG: filamentous hemagglutinin N-terminal domain-containing protein [Cyanobacteria bacterium P01_F01_bin.150]